MYEFNAEKIKQDIIDWIECWFMLNGGKDTPAIIGISGGKDSTICAALLIEALGKDRVIGVTMPQGENYETDSAYEVANYLKIPLFNIDIEDACIKILKDVSKLGDLISQTVENVPPRIRMTYLYAISSVYNGRVCNCSNLSEDYVGYTTKWGSGGDFAPIADLTVSEVRQIGLALEIPEHLVNKIPHDGLQGKSDEEKLGLTYKDIDRYIRSEGKDVSDIEITNKITKMHLANRHKFEPIPRYKKKI